MDSKLMIKFTPGDTFIERMTGSTKVRLFFICTVYLIMSFDLRLIMPMFIASLAALISVKPKWSAIRALALFVLFFNLLNIFMYYLADPGIGMKHAGTENILIQFNSYFYLSGETLWYFVTRLMKMTASFTVTLAFICSTTPSEFASGLNSIKVPYKICTVVALAYRFIPDIARDYKNISISMQARGVEMDQKKTSLLNRIKQAVMILIPLVISSFDKVGNIANAMDLRGFGKGTKKTWYSEHEETKGDKLFKVVNGVLLIFCLSYIIYRIISPDYKFLWYPF